MKKTLRTLMMPLSVLVFVTHLKPIEIKAQTYNGVIARSMGGAGRAAVDPLDVGRMNPGGLIHLRNYSFGAQYREQSFASDSEGFLWTVALSDGTEAAAFPGAFIYEKKFKYSDLGRVEQDHYSLSVAQRVHDTLGVGLTVHHLSSAWGATESSSQIQGDLGLMWAPAPILGLGLVGYNLAGSKSGELAAANSFRSLGLGGHVLLDFFRVRLDYMHQLEENSASRGHLMAGFESLIFEWFAMRAGWFEDGLHQQRAWTLGLGFDGPRLKFNLSAELPSTAESETRYGIDMMVQF